MMKRFLCFFFALISTTDVFSQSGKAIYNDSLLHEIRIQIDLPNWFEKLEENYYNNLHDPENYPEIYLLCHAIIDGEVIDSIGIREKGNYSNGINSIEKKKPFKLAFDEFKKQKFNGVKKINLNNGTDDPSFLRESLVFKLMRDEGIPAPRTSHAKLYINDEYWGLYLMVENVDKTFLKDHYGSKGNDGNLYKTDRGAQVFLNWRETDTTAYIDEGLLLKTNKPVEAWSRMFQFIDIINNTAPEEMHEKLSAVFDVESYLTVLALEKLVYSWDSYWGNGNNFYMYEHPDGKIRWIPWDFNESFQKHKGLLKVVLPDPFYLVPTDKFDKRPLLKAIFSVPEWKNRYMEIVCSMLGNNYQLSAISPTLINWQNIIYDAYREDPNQLNSFENFNVSLTEDTEHIIDFPKTGFAFTIILPGLLPFIESQRSWAGSQLLEHKYDCIYPKANDIGYKLSLFPNPATEVVSMKWDKERLNVSEIMIFNLTGEMVIKTHWLYHAGNEVQLDVGMLHPGFYIVKKQDADGTYGIGKMVKY